jgi:branched-chain amino acid transport system substrate-binding protein
VKQYADFGLKGEIALGVGGWMVSPLSLPAEGEAAQGIIGVLNYVPSIDNPVNVGFRKSFETKFNRSVSEYAAYGFDTGKLIYAALQKLNGDTRDKAAFVQALHDVKIQGTRGDLKIDPKTNNLIQDIYVFKIEKIDGKAGYTIVDHLHDVQDPENGCRL